MKQTEFWLSRNKNAGSFYGLSHQEPELTKGLCWDYYKTEKCIIDFCQMDWEKLMRPLRLKPGQCRKVVICEAELEGMDGMFIGFAKEKK